ncbi:aromatic-ring-hydroxylating dioxygenase subunit beta [Ilumatobacter coccineus]|uniref:Putative aromatic-ring-hydroxylating dioxygenase beta subunit n=1 Tax=Ilumatobacter coccineus (strain NBRC 103263 / KCTC 29153 / YM16-304) TaxID=1313172 RepID=A0A6C7E256_ILUCY|nr:aromatic-ring-hydroxylating dioxygenase subunit beta [Ilumatobacter coccineus]BAN00913.1 putative aromatic-ring-hydroxylating dioxygenase beta subunit [Ilumatobacter coccineus YM16-304]
MASPTITNSPTDRLADVEQRCAQLGFLVDSIAARQRADPEVSAQAAAILFHEARLLDAQRYEDWLESWADDGIWWVPIAHTSPDANAQSLALDDVRRLRERVAWMTDPAAWSQHPATRVVRSVNAVEAWFDGPDRLVASSALTLSSVRRGNVRVVAGRQVHEFVVDRSHPLASPFGDLRLRSKVILLIDSEIGQSNPGYLL